MPIALKLRLPWGWNTGSHELISTYDGAAGNPDVSEPRNAAVEPSCREYVELRYRLMPYRPARFTTVTALACP